MTKFLSPVFEGAKPSSGTTPAAGGGAAGAVSMASNREEVKAGLIRQGRGGGRPWRNSLDRPAGDGGNVSPRNAEIGKLAVRKAAQLGNGVPVAAPVAVVADQVHRTSRSSIVQVFYLLGTDGRYDLPARFKMAFGA